MSSHRADCPSVPADFPTPAQLSAVSGMHPKIALVQEDGKFYAPGASPSEVAEAFEMCADLVEQMVPYCQRKLSQFGGDKKATVEAALQGLLRKQWCTPEQSTWIMHKAASRLGWPHPDECLTAEASGKV